jgi:hypothetical protein
MVTLLIALGHETMVANPRKLRAIYANEDKADQVFWRGWAGRIRSCRGGFGIGASKPRRTWPWCGRGMRWSGPGRY